MDKPIISVIIPCTRPQMAEKTIESLLNQNYPSGNTLEIIVVGQSSPGLKRKRLIKIIKGKFTPSQARNRGAQLSLGDYLFFIDDDCMVSHNWLKENLLALRNDKIGAVSGMVIGKSKDFFARCTDFSNFDLCQAGQRCERVICSASMAMRKATFGKTKGFDETLRVGEDLDLCYQLMQKGYKTVYEPKIKIYHDHRQNTLSKLLGYMYFGGRNSGLYTQKKYAGLNKNSQFFQKIQLPPVFVFFLLPISLFMAVKSFSINVKEHKEVILYFPFIFLAKLSYNIGVLVWLIKEKNKLSV